MQQPTPENLKAEMARHRIRRAEICDLIGMHPNQLSQYVNLGRTLTPWAAHNIGWAINTLVRQDVFNVDMRLRPLTAPRGRPPLHGTVSDGRPPAPSRIPPPWRGAGPEPDWVRRARADWRLLAQLEADMEAGGGCCCWEG